MLIWPAQNFGSRVYRVYKQRNEKIQGLLWRCFRMKCMPGVLYLLLVRLLQVATVYVLVLFLLIYMFFYSPFYSAYCSITMHFNMLDQKGSNSCFDFMTNCIPLRCVILLKLKNQGPLANCEMSHLVFSDLTRIFTHSLHSPPSSPQKCQ